MFKKLQKILKNNSLIIKLYTFLLGLKKLDSKNDPILFRLYEKIIIFNEIKKFEKLDNKQIDIVYDCNVSALTLGDFCDVAMVARFFNKKNYCVRIIFINDKFRNKYYRKNLQKAKLRLQEYKIILKSFVDFKIPIIDCKWKNYKSEKFKKNFTFFNSKVLSRKPIYNFCFNFLHTILKKEKKTFLKNYLLNKDNFIISGKKKFIKKKYITLGCRHDPESEKNLFFNRNLKPDEFIKIIKTLKKKYYNHQIMVISDNVGTKYFKNIAKKNNLKLLYSKNFSKSYVEDGYLILKSKFYFQFLGGGMVSFLIYSKLNFLWFSFPQNHHSTISNKKYCYWHGNTNFYYEIHSRDCNKFLRTIKKIDMF